MSKGKVQSPKMFDVPVSYFFDDMSSNVLPDLGRKGFGEADTPSDQRRIR